MLLHSQNVEKRVPSRAISGVSGRYRNKTSPRQDTPNIKAGPISFNGFLGLLIATCIFPGARLLALVVFRSPHPKS